MKRRLVSTLLIMACSLSMALVGCGAKEEKKEEVKEEKKEVVTLKIGASPNVIEVVKAMEDSLEKEGN